MRCLNIRSLPFIGKTEDRPLYRRKNYKDRASKEKALKEQNLLQRVYNEPWEWYDKCNKRQRNQGMN